VQYAIIGLGTFGKKVALTLTQKGASVIGIDKDKERVEEMKDRIGVALSLDATDEEAVKAAQIEDVDAAVVALGDAQEEAILTTAILKRMGISPIVARAMDSLYAHVLTLVGADTVVVIEEQMGEEIAKQLLTPDIHEKIVLTTGHVLAEIKAKREFVGKTLQELDFRKTLGVNVISIQKRVSRIGDDGKAYETIELNDVPGPQDKIQDGDILLVVGAESDVERLATGK
jgi:trk system potassium uptake protein TrkA